MMKRLLFFALILCLSLLYGCGGDKAASPSSRTDSLSALHPVYDLDSILEAGEIVVATLEGADTYTAFEDTIIGLQYALADSLARYLGVRLRMEVAADTAEYMDYLHSSDIDVYALWLDSATWDTLPVTPSAPYDEVTGKQWAVRQGAVGLQQLLSEWGTSALCDSVEQRLFSFLRQRCLVRKNEQSPYISLEKDIISIYDEHFKRAARSLNLDWHFIAALSYEESGFDPNAVSGAGARGLMQVMEKTAAQYGISDFLEPRQNVDVATKHLKDLLSEFSDIPDRYERLKFVVAAYDCGLGHVRDAQSLCRKDGRDARLWQNVSSYCLKLSNASGYRDPIVKYGVMIGEEPVMHVIKVLRRWEQYVGHLPTLIPSFPGDANAVDSLAAEGRVSAQQIATGTRPHPKPSSSRANRFTQGTTILGPNDPRLLRVQGDTTP